MYEIIDISEDNVNEETKMIYQSDYKVEHSFIDKLYKQELEKILKFEDFLK